ncbi:MAG TPA: 2-amino-4-hydroxy-6-hydroxymethyldihydropteridine diphosphokinase [Woeseiaceae bacterium]|nr:2-amino-4-hydroxy-6-hydroxymethyldihydropteridine diphosphokinase [Woeseiaceae bacterium]
MPRVYLGLGSNIDPATNLRLAVRELRFHFGQLRLSSVYRSTPLGFDGDDFLNAVVGLDTDLLPEEIPPLLDDIHAMAGRPRDKRKLVSRTLDIDFLLYDRLVLDRSGLRLPRRDVLMYGFVLRPLAELAPDYLHPETGRRLAEHWCHFDAGSHPLSRVGIDLD